MFKEQTRTQGDIGNNRHNRILTLKFVRARFCAARIHVAAAPAGVYKRGHIGAPAKSQLPAEGRTSPNEPFSGYERTPQQQVLGASAQEAQAAQLMVVVVVVMDGRP
jgi:hypothetical protein